MELNLKDIWLAIIYPAILVIASLLINPKKIKRKYLWWGLIVIIISGIIFPLLISDVTNIPTEIIISFFILPLIIALTRFLFLPFLFEYRRLRELRDILGAVDWGAKRSKHLDTVQGLREIKNSFDFMGFGFAKYLRADKEEKISDDVPNLKDLILWEKLTLMLNDPSNKAAKILLMHPHAEELDKHHRAKDPSYPSVEGLYFSLDRLSELKRSFGELISVRFYPKPLTYKPAFRLLFANDSDLYLSFYKWGIEATELPFLHIRKGENTFYHPFKVLFDYLWEHVSIRIYFCTKNRKINVYHFDAKIFC